MSQYTYQDYLKAWQGNFEDEEQGETTIYIFGKPVKRTIHKLTYDEFCKHLSELERLGDAYNIGMQEDNDEKQDNALKESFPHEIALLL